MGTFLHRVMEGLVARLAADKWNVVRREAITPSSIKAWRKAGRRVLLVEARLPKDGRMPRLDLAEIDFGAKRIKVHDYVPTSDSAHQEKTRAYADELAELTGLKATADDVEYVDAGQLTDNLTVQ